MGARIPPTRRQAHAAPHRQPVVKLVASRAGHDGGAMDQQPPIPPLLDYTSRPHCTPSHWPEIFSFAAVLCGGLGALMSYGGYVAGFADGQRHRAIVLMALSIASIAAGCFRLRRRRQLRSSDLMCLLGFCVACAANLVSAYCFVNARFG